MGLKPKKTGRMIRGELLIKEKVQFPVPQMKNWVFSKSTCTELHD